MLPPEIRENIEKLIGAADHPREQVINVCYILQKHYGYFSDEAVREAAALLTMTPLEVEELATFYDFLYREPVGKFVIHVCDGVVCWMHHENSIFDYLCRKLGVCAGAVTADGLFTVLPTACIGFCDQAPAMLINGVFYGSLTPAKVDEIIEQLRSEHCDLVICK
ncbi:MAG: NADH-quinone oxidoreductase subunit NuoE [Thermodesulfobacteriota bacterium]